MTPSPQPPPRASAPLGPRFYEHSCFCGCSGRLEMSKDPRPNRIPSFLPGHNAKTGFEQWVADNRGKHFCACGCGESFEPSRQHRRKGFPRFKRGHALRVTHPRAKNIAGWVREQQGEHSCACGCGRTIRIHPSYYRDGIPSFRRECMLRLRVRENHPNWVADRSLVRSGRGGQYLVPSIRREIFQSDGYRCRACGSTENLTTDHVIPVCEAGDGTASNGQTLCVDCHKEKSRRDRERYWERRRNERAGEADGHHRQPA
ncbi:MULTISPECIES: HNH endonuclease [Myxococcaceae]|uniref:HNH nuclease n=1 Tax=Corallococcus macrosporus DSM 14697 TaxID=1189310 RepID=A0A250JRN6_9BACT|nr:HNH nuclease [Corallococcus macrosporus DSM 14697]